MFGGARNVNSNGLMRFATTLSVDIFQITNNTIKANILTNRYNVVSQADCYYLTNNGFSLEMNSKNLWFTSEVFTMVSEVSEHFKNNPTLVKYQLATPQFIPLPHDQQVKLRTFANKTNISFGCEIEGTIKAQVPKSIGATVNTHTEQINNLNKELDRVKKLEESTVSTVTTESDFTTVEATSNGYFEDVKLEGKTLVNYISNFNNWSNMGSTTVSEDGASMTINATSWNRGRQISKSLPSGEYIFSINNPNKATIVVQNKTNAKTLVMSNDINICIKFSLLEVSEILITCKNTSETGTYVVNNPILTTDKNVNGYFEGLKSVGQSATTSEDGADEIVVSSVNENLISIEDIATLTNYMSSNANYYIQPLFIGKGNTCYMNVELNEISTDSNVVFLLSNHRVNPHYSYKKIVYPNNTTLVISDSIKADDNGYVYLACHLLTNLEKATSFINKISLSCKDNKYTPHQSDKKRLLYYNEETQAWEKPILREWDSIEKHSDGKYYYHQRSGEVVLNGSENWAVKSDLPTDNPQGTHMVFYVQDTTFPISVRPNDLTSIVWISDIIPSISHTQGWYNSIEGLHFGTFNIPQGSNNCRYYINILKSKLPTQDVQGFKQWLQANNVTVVYQLAEEKVYECTNIDLITYANETNYIVESGAIVPRTTLKVHNNISNVVSLLQKKVSLLESNITNYMITQNRIQLASTYSADSVTFKVVYALCSEEVEYNEDLYNLILNNILVGKDNYDYDKMFNIILDYTSWNQISWEQFDILVGVMDIQHNPPVEDEVIEEIPNEIM